MITSIRRINSLHSNPGRLDSVELNNARILTLAALEKGIKIERVNQGFGGNNPIGLDAAGNRFMSDNHGNVWNVDENQLEDYESDEKYDYEKEEYTEE